MTGRRERSAMAMAVSTLLVLGTTGIACAAFWPVYETPQYLVLCFVAASVAALIALAGAVLRWSSLVLLLASVLALAVIGVPLAVPRLAAFGLLPTPEGLRELAVGAALGWKQLLTITLPVGAYQALLVPALLLVFGTVLVALSVALRARFGELGAIAPVVFFLVALAFGPDRASWPRLLGLGLLGVTLLWVVWQRWHRRRQAIHALAAQAPDDRGRPLETARDLGVVGARSIAAAAAIIALAAAGSLAATTLAPTDAPRRVLRTVVEQPFEPRDQLSPLSAFRSYLQPAAADRVMLSVSGLPAGARLRVATLDSYDGVVYAVGSPTVDSASAPFTRVPLRLDQSTVDGTPLSIEVTVGDYSGVWVPSIGQLVSVDFAGENAGELGDGFVYNDTSGTAATLAGLAAGDRYRLEAVLPAQPSERALATVTPGTAEVPAPLILPEGVAEFSDEATRGATTPGERLAALASALRDRGFLSHGLGADEPPSRSGHAADRITELLTEPRMIGDGEQYAVAGALMARRLGFPARVVVGFAPPENATGDGGVVQLHGSDVAAWFEVNTAEYGWVAVDPTPPAREVPDETPEEPSTVSRPQTVVPPPLPEPDTPDAQEPPDVSQDDPPQADPWLEALLIAARVAGWAALVIAIAIAPFLVIVAAKLRRRRLRRRAANALERIRGGWQEFEDTAIDHGYVLPPAATRSEVAASVGGSAARGLAAVADRAVFAPSAPDPNDPDRVWRAVDELRRAFGRVRTRRERLRAAVSLRSLGAGRAASRHSRSRRL